MSDLDKEIQKCIAKIVSQASEDNILIETRLNWLKFDLNQAFEDAQAIDEQCQLDTTKRLLESMRKGMAVKVAVAYTLYSRDLKTFKKVKENLLTNTYTYNKEFHLWRIREQLRDKIPIKNLLISYADILTKMAKKGDEDFFLRFGAIVKQAIKQPDKFDRGSERWIIRGWLCLALWDVENTMEAYERCQPVAEYMGINMPTYLSFEEAYQKAKSRERDHI